MSTPPDKTPAVIHKIRILHKDIYTIGQKLSKRDKLGIHADIEKECLTLLKHSIKATLTNKRDVRKIEFISATRTLQQTLANLIRTEFELKILAEKQYLYLSSQTVEIGRMLSGWFISQTQQKEP